MKSKYPRFSPEWWAWMTTPEPNSGCILWLGCVCEKGYGRVGYSKAGGSVLVHRIAFECAHGPILEGRHVCHRCDTPSCVNPDHLFIGTQEDNMRDMFAKGRARPQGIGRKRVAIERTVAAAVPLKELSSADSNASVSIVDCIHLIRTNGIQASWRHVTGVPAKRPTQAIVPYNRPELVTPQPAKGASGRLVSVSTVAECCAARPALSGAWT